MSQFHALKAIIDTNPELSTLLRQTTEAMRDYVTTNQPAWDAEDERISADAKAAGKRAWGIPFRLEPLIVEGDTEVQQAFIISRLEFSGAGTDESKLAAELREQLGEYKGSRAAPSPAP
jgi:hypothetical protein